MLRLKFQDFCYQYFFAASAILIINLKLIKKKSQTNSLNLSFEINNMELCFASDDESV